jgi:hypothetical protein
MHFHSIVAVLVHVPDGQADFDWYQAAFLNAKRFRTESEDFECSEIDGIQLEIVCQKIRAALSSLCLEIAQC